MGIRFIVNNPNKNRGEAKENILVGEKKEDMMQNKVYTLKMNMKEGFALLGTEFTSPTIDVYIYIYIFLTISLNILSMN